MNKKILMFAILGIFLLSFISASVVDTTKAGEDYILKINCFDNDGCSDLVECNATIFNPDNSILLSEQVMQNQGESFNLTINGSLLINTGDYNVVGLCIGGSSQDDFNFDIAVTPSGESGSAYQIYYLIAFILVFFVGFYGFFSKVAWVSALGGMSMILLGIYIANNGIIIFRDTLTVALSYITIGLGAGFLLIPAVEVIEDNL